MKWAAIAAVVIATGCDHCGDDCMRAHHERVFHPAHDDLIFQPVWNGSDWAPQPVFVHSDAYTSTSLVCEEWERR